KTQKNFPKESALSEYGCVVAITYSGREIALYRNGVLSARYTAASEALAFGGDARVFLGQRHEGATDFLAGALMDVRIYDRALSAEQIARLRPNTALDAKPW